MKLLFLLAPLTAVFLLAGISIKAVIAIENTRADMLVELRLLFGLIPVKLKANAGLVLSGGLGLSVNGKAPKPLSEYAKRGGAVPLRAIRRSVRIESLDITGGVGIKDRPDKSVIIAGSLASLFTQISAALSRRPKAARIAPVFDRGAFALKVEGIMSVTPGKLLMEIIKNRRRRK